MLVVFFHLINFWLYPQSLWLCLITLPILGFGYADYFQSRHAVLRNFPLLGRFRYLLELIRPEIYQYFVESNSNGVPFSRNDRSLVYQRSKKALDTQPFGTQLDVYAVGYEWVNHSMGVEHVDPNSLRIKVGGSKCTQPHDASIFNISAMSYGALSKNAILALNGGAKDGNFLHNTGEGGVSQHHLENGGGLIWQIGTGYFGCRTLNGEFSREKFKEKVSHPSIKMIEVKISQGAKPGHGGILPKEKLTAEICRDRGVEMGADVVSPPVHNAFSTPIEMMNFIQELRELSDGKPVGFKLCVGKRREFIALCKAMKSTGNIPDFIVIDGGEGGTGAAPVEFANHIGSPGLESLMFVDNCLRGFGIREETKIFTTGKVASGFDLVKRLALGADVVYAARPFMMSLGCIQALKCNSNECPVGVATQDPNLTEGLHVTDKRTRVFQFHEETVNSVAHILGTMGYKRPNELRPWHVFRRVSPRQVMHYGELIERVSHGELLGDKISESYKRALELADENSFRKYCDL